MSKGSKEAKKTKAPPKTPVAGVATPKPVNGSRPVPRKKWPTS